MISTTGISLASGLPSLVQAQSSDLYYVVSGNSLYSYSTGVFSSLKSFAGFEKYGISSYSNQIIVWGANSTGSANNFIVTQFVQILKVNSGSVSLISTLSFNAFSSLTDYVVMRTSPLLTKLYFEYLENPLNTSSTISIYDIDFENSIITSIIMKNPSNYLTTTSFMSSFASDNFFLGDYYLVVRNNSGSSHANASAAVEATYQFMG